jgi:hypothetical protein
VARRLFMVDVDGGIWRISFSAAGP